MKLTVKTAILQSMTARAMKGASCNKMLPITGFMYVRLRDNKLSLVTTDATNYLYITQDKVLGENFSVVVEAEVFSKLISRLTCENVTLELTDNSLVVKGNGSYRMDLPLDEEGEPVTFPDPVDKINSVHSDWVPDEKCVINLSTARLILAVAKASLAKTDEIPCYTGYYCGDKIVATDASVMCGIGIKLWDKPALIGAEMMDLLDVFTQEKIEVERCGSKILFTSADCTLYGKVMDSIADYQIDDINVLLDQSFDSHCRISKAALLQLLDRLVLFVSVYDRNSIDLTFTMSGLQISSKQANSVEIIPYSESYNFTAFTGSVDIEMFRAQVKASVGDYIELYYGADNAVMFVDGNITQVIGLIDG